MHRDESVEVIGKFRGSDQPLEHIDSRSPPGHRRLGHSEPMHPQTPAQSQPDRSERGDSEPAHPEPGRYAPNYENGRIMRCFDTWPVPPRIAALAELGDQR